MHEDLEYNHGSTSQKNQHILSNFVTIFKRNKKRVHPVKPNWKPIEKIFRLEKHNKNNPLHAHFGKIKITLAKSKSVSKQNSFHNFKTLKQMSSLIQKKSVSRQYKHNETVGDWKKSLHSSCYRNYFDSMYQLIILRVYHYEYKQKRAEHPTLLLSKDHCLQRERTPWLVMTFNT